MKLTINSVRFQEALKKVNGISDARNTLAILGNVKITADSKTNTIKMVATNLDIALVTECECQSVDESGETTVPMKKLEQTVAVLPVGAMTITVDNRHRMTIKAGNSRMTIGGTDPEAYPMLPSSTDEVTYTIPATVLRDMIRKTSYAMSRDDTRKTLESVMFHFSNKSLKAVATDGRRLALSERDMDIEVTESVEYIVPLTAITVLSRLINTEGDVTIKAAKTLLTFAQNEGKHVIYTKLIDGKYPDYNQVIPKGERSKVIIDRLDFIEVINRVSIMASASSPSVKMTFNESTLDIDVGGDDNCDAHEKMQISWDGTQKCELLFNPKYVIDTLKSSDSDKVCLHIDENGVTPVIITAEKEPMLAVIMPLRRN